MKVRYFALVLFIFSGELLANGDLELIKRFSSFKIYLQEKLHPYLIKERGFDPKDIQEILANANPEDLVSEELIEFIPNFANKFVQSNDLVSLYILVAMNIHNPQEQQKALDQFCTGIPFIFLQIDFPTTSETFFASIASYMNTYWGTQFISGQIKLVYQLLPIPQANPVTLPAIHNDPVYTEAATGFDSKQ